MEVIEMCLRYCNEVEEKGHELIGECCEQIGAPPKFIEAYLDEILELVHRFESRTKRERELLEGQTEFPISASPSPVAVARSVKPDAAPDTASGVYLSGNKGKKVCE